MFRAAVMALLCILVLTYQGSAREIIEYKDAEMIRQEEQGVMVFKTKDGEIKAKPSLSFKAFDKDGKAMPSGVGGALDKDKDTPHSMQVLKIGNVMDIKVDMTNAKAIGLLQEAHLVKGEFLTGKVGNPITKNKPDDKPKTKSKDDSKAEDAAKKNTVYSKVTIKAVDDTELTFEDEGKTVTVQIPKNFKLLGFSGTAMKASERGRVLKVGNVVDVTTKKDKDKEVVTEIKWQPKAGGKGK
jgi:hypothetical protein